MDSRDEETLELKETYTSLQQEVDIKTKKLKKVAAMTSLLAATHSRHICSGRRRCLILEAQCSRLVGIYCTW